MPIMTAIEPLQRADRPIAAGTTIGHVHLRTADIDRVKAFYVGVLGFDVIAEVRDLPGWGTTGDALFVSAGGYHHHLGFNTWKSAGGPPQPDGVCGLHHVALLFPTRRDLADVIQRLVDVDWPLRPLTGPRTHRAGYISDRPRHPRGGLHLGPRRQRPRALLGPGAVRVAARRTRPACVRGRHARPRGPARYAVSSPARSCAI